MWLGERWGRVGAPAGWEAEPPGSGAYSWNRAGWGGGQGQAGGLEQGRARRAGLRLQPSPVLRGAPSVQDNPSVPVEGKKPLEPRTTRLGPGSQRRGLPACLRSTAGATAGTYASTRLRTALRVEICTSGILQFPLRHQGFLGQKTAGIDPSLGRACELN